MSATSMLSPGSERPAVMNGMKKTLKPIKQSNIKIKETPTADGLPVLTQPKNIVQPTAQGY